MLQKKAPAATGARMGTQMNKPTVQRPAASDKETLEREDSFSNDPEIVKEREIIDRHSLEMLRLKANIAPEPSHDMIGRWNVAFIKQLYATPLYEELKRQKEEAEARLEARRRELQTRASPEVANRAKKETRHQQYKTLFAAAGKTQSAVAEEIKVDLRTLQRYITGKTESMFPAGMLRLAKAVGIPLEKLPK
jgi:hypothetical protein